MRSLLFIVLLTTACAHRPLGTAVVIQSPSIKDDAPTKIVCASITREKMGDSTHYSCDEWMSVPTNARGWDAWGDPIH